MGNLSRARDKMKTSSTSRSFQSIPEGGGVVDVRLKIPEYPDGHRELWGGGASSSSGSSERETNTGLTTVDGTAAH